MFRVRNMLKTGIYSCLLPAAAIAATPAYAVMNGHGQDIFPVTSTFNSTVTVVSSAFSVGGDTLTVTAGKVGIGTGAPASALHVVGGGPGYANAFIVDTDADNGGTIVLGNDPDNGDQVRIGVDGYLRSQNGRFGLDSTGVPITFEVNENEKMRVASDGDVAIGASNPGTSRFWLQGGDADDFHLQVSSQDGTGSLLVVDKAGNVGIGTASPAYPLSIYRAAGAGTFNFESGASGGVVQSRLAGLGGDAVPQVWATGMNISSTHAGFEIYDYTAGKSRLYISSNTGSIGIGTTAPASMAKLDVKGDDTSSTAYGIGVRNSADSYSFVVRNDGRVGIGTVTPTALLDISSDSLRVEISSTIISATDQCNPGEIRWDSGFIYVCVAANSWKRAALSSW